MARSVLCASLAASIALTFVACAEQGGFEGDFSSPDGALPALDASPDGSLNPGDAATADANVTDAAPDTNPGGIALTVAKAGNGTGTVASSPAGINCGTTCVASFAPNTVVNLTATPAAGSRLTGWSGGGCSGTGACAVTLAAATTVTATFDLNQRGSIYLIRDDTDTLQRIANPDVPAITDVGALGIGFAFGDCAWHAGNNTLYVVEGRATNSLYRVNVTTGAATLVGVHGITDMFSLAYYPTTNTLYGNAGSGPGSLYTLNVTTGAATLVGTSGYLNGMVWDPIRNQMMTITSGGVINTINITTGALAAFSGTVISNNNGLTYDPATDYFWVANYNGAVSKYNGAAAWAATPVLTGVGQHTAICYVP